jgi:hypothetical protein
VDIVYAYSNYNSIALAARSPITSHSPRCGIRR